MVTITTVTVNTAITTVIVITNTMIVITVATIKATKFINREEL
jgi:hypothetical protein